MRREFSNTCSPSSCQSHCNSVKNETIISYYQWKLINSLTLKNRRELANSPLFFQGGIDQFPGFKIFKLSFFQKISKANSPLFFQGGIGQFPPVFSRGNWPIPPCFLKKRLYFIFVGRRYHGMYGLVETSVLFLPYYNDKRTQE